MSRYKPEKDGFREIGQSSEMGAFTLDVAKQLAGNANAVGDSKYEAEHQTVTGGWENERRAGAVVRESEPHWRDWRDGVLLRVTAAMRARDS